MLTLTLAQAQESVRYDQETGLLTLTETGDTAGYFDKSNGYWRVRIGGTVYYAHNVIWLLMTGVYPGHKEVDHEDRDRTNNRWSNLRRATPSLQQANRIVQSNNKIGVKGVSLCKSTGQYRADINVRGHRINLGRRKTVEEASALYADAAKHHFGEFARTA